MRRRIDSRIGEGGEPAHQDTRAVRGAVSAEGRRTGLGEVRPPAPGPSGTNSTPIRPPYRQLANDQAGTAPTADRRFVRPAGLAGDPPPGRLLRSCSPIARRPLPAPADAGSLEGGSPGHGPHWSSAACHRRRPARRWADLVVHRSLNRSSTALRDRDAELFRAFCALVAKAPAQRPRSPPDRCYIRASPGPLGLLRPSVSTTSLGEEAHPRARVRRRSRTRLGARP